LRHSVAEAYSTFTLAEWQREKLKNKKGEPDGWAFWFSFEGDVALWLGANTERQLEPAKNELFRLADTRKDLFGSGRGISLSWPTVWKREIASERELRQTRQDALSRIEGAWRTFLERDLPPIREACNKALDSLGW
jgi:hypothetical protein